MTALQNVPQIFSDCALTTLKGVGLLGKIRTSHSLTKGLHEQRLICSLSRIGDIVVFINRSKENIGALFPDKTIISSSSLIKISFVFGVALHHAANYLENSDYIWLKYGIDLIYKGIPDLTLLASIVQHSVAIYFGISPLKNAIYLSFLIWCVLEQGLFLATERENAGLLYRVFDGEIVKLYNPYVKKISDIASNVLLYEYGGLFGKMIAIPTLALKLPTLCPEVINSQFRRIGNLPFFQNILEKFNNDLPPIPTNIPKIWKTSSLTEQNSPNFQITQKVFRRFECNDQFPDRELEELLNQVKEQIQQDRGLTKEQKANLESLFSQDTIYSKGILPSNIPCGEGILKHDYELRLKNILGALCQDWNRYKIACSEKYSEFMLCLDSVNLTLNKLHQEIYLEINKTENEGKLSPALLKKNRLNMQILFVLQAMRDESFIETHQKDLQLLKTGELFSLYAKDSETKLNKKTIGLFHKCTHLFRYYYYTCFKWVWKTRPVQYFVCPYLENLQSNKHTVNYYRTIFGTTLGLSDYEIALADRDKSHSSTIMEKLLSHLDFIHKKPYTDTWFEKLARVIVNPSDPRIKLDDFRECIFYMADEGQHQDEVAEDSTAIYGDQGQKSEFVHKYLPQVLHDLGYIINL